MKEQEQEQTKSFSNIWSFSNDIIKKNNKVKKSIYSEIPDEDKIADNVHGYVINNLGNIVAQFGFFLNSDLDENSEVFDLKISVDGFLGRIYNEPTNIILGYGHPTGFTALIDPKFAQILHLGPEATNGNELIVSIPNDDMLKERGINFIIRDIDVDLNLLTDDIKDNFIQNLKDAAEEISDMNELEKSYNAYMRHLYVILGEKYTNNSNEPEEEEFYE